MNEFDRNQLTLPGRSPARPDPTLTGPVRHWAEVTPDRPALTSDGLTRTWAQLHERVLRVAQGLLAEGVQPGDRVVYLARNRAEFYEIAYGASLVGAVLAAINWRLSPAEASALLSRSEAVVLFAEPVLVAPLEGPTARSVIGLGDPVSGFEPWLSRHPAVDPGLHFAPSEPVLQMYTSGTTGLPKAAVFSHSAIRSATGVSEISATGPDSVVLVSLPVFHAAGGVMGFLSLCLGAHVVVSSDLSPEGLVRQVQEFGVTTTVVVPTVLQMLVDSPVLETADLSSLRRLGYAGAPMSPQLQQECLARLSCELFQVYGSTEIMSGTGLDHADHVDEEHPQRRNSVGRALPGTELRVVDPATGLDQPEGVPGEVWVRNRTSMSCYWGEPEQTAQVITTDGFVRTGDGGYLRDGYLYLSDRIRDVIISGGENVYPTEVENVLVAHPAVAEVGVVGVPSRRWGETVRAVVVRRPGAAVEADELVAFCRERLAHFKCPTVVDFVDALPRNASGKILRRRLREPEGAG